MAAVARQLVRTLYMDRHDLFSHVARVTEVGHGVQFKGKNYHWIKLNETIFHPHGGGQLCDQGTINGRRVDFVYKEKMGGINDFEVLHCFEDPVDFKVGESVRLEVDKENRYLNSLWHTAAHAVDFFVVKSFPQLTGYSGQCYPNEAFMKFTSADGSYPSADEVRQKVEAAFQQEIDTPISVVRDAAGVRKIRLGSDRSPHDIPCGGTHVHSFRELGALRIKNATWKAKDKPHASLLVSFHLENPHKM